MKQNRLFLSRTTKVVFGLALTLCLAGGAVAQDCPDAPDHSVEESEIIQQLKTAPSVRQAQPLNNELWELWLDAPDAKAKSLLNDGMALRRVYDLAASVAVLSQLIEYCPNYAEGWNQRAFSYYMAGQMEPALLDLDRALELNPRHIGALSGRALTLMGMGRAQLAQQALRDALRLNPWLPERAYLVGPLPKDT